MYVYVLCIMYFVYSYLLHMTGSLDGTAGGLDTRERLDDFIESQ